MNIFITLYAVGALIGFLLGVKQTYFHKNPYGLTPLLLPYGIFVWGDAVILGFFWFIVSLVCLLFNNVSLFIVIQLVYWMVRSAGEIIYWFLQQFAVNKRDLPKTLWGQAFFPGESIWFAYQLFWQIILVISTVGLLFYWK